ncbi:MAG: hypothetical protein KDA95_10385, partial [Acidimicrobiales bacterium]|nr:hypothetical protein [Acidimicrobiales bacterium]
MSPPQIASREAGGINGAGMVEAGGGVGAACEVGAEGEGADDVGEVGGTLGRDAVASWEGATRGAGTVDSKRPS